MPPKKTDSEPTSASNLLTVGEAAERLNLTYGAVYKQIQAGRIKTLATAGGTKLVTIQEVAKYPSREKKKKPVEEPEQLTLPGVEE